MDKTYPYIVGPRIMELTAAQRDALAWRQMSSEDKIAVLLTRVETLEATVVKLTRASARAAPFGAHHVD